MAVEMTSLAIDLDRERDGEWVEYPEWPGVAFKVSPHETPAYRMAFARMTIDLARQHKGRGVPVEVQQVALGKVYCKHILRGWRGFDIEYSQDAARKVLSDPAYRLVLNAIGWCANQVGKSQVEFVQKH